MAISCGPSPRRRAPPAPRRTAPVRRRRLDRETRLKRLRFRSWHRGTKEADLLIGGFFDAHGYALDAGELDLFEALLEEQDADIIGWAMGVMPVPDRWQGQLMDRIRALGYVPIAR